MKVLVTGGAGFIGSHLVEEYLKEGFEVSIIDDLSTGDESNIFKNASFHQMDICSKETYDFIKDQQFDIINHHAAQIDVRIAVEKPMIDANINILGTLNVLEAAVKSKVKKFIFASSGGGVYGEIPDHLLPADEAFPINPLSHYGASKHAIEHYLFLYQKLYGLNYTCFRYGNVYGERQAKKGEAGVIAIFCQRMKKNKQVSIYGDGEQLRDYVYVKDLVEANMIVSKDFSQHSKSLHFNDWTFNIGTEKATSVNQLHAYLKKTYPDAKEPSYEDPRTGEILKTYISCQKAKDILGWSAAHSIEQGLSKTAGWFKENDLKG